MLSVLVWIYAQCFWYFCGWFWARKYLTMVSGNIGKCMPYRTDVKLKRLHKFIFIEKALFCVQVFILPSNWHCKLGHRTEGLAVTSIRQGRVVRKRTAKREGLARDFFATSFYFTWGLPRFYFGLNFVIPEHEAPDIRDFHPKRDNWPEKKMDKYSESW